MRFLLIAALLGALTGCGGAKKKAEAEGDAATAVQVVTAEQDSIQRTVTADAVLYPVAQSAITPKIGAPVKRILVNRGDHVRAGQLLAELENRDLAAALGESKALYEQAQAQFLATTKGTLPEDLTKSRADVESARQALDAAKKLYENRVALVKEGALAQKLADDAKVAMVQAQSQLDTAQRHLESAQNVNGEQLTRSAQSQVDAAKARYANAQAQMSYSEIRSPIDGVVADRPGNPGEMASSGTPLITVVDISEIVARANVPVRDISHIKLGDAATITGPDGDLKGRVSVVSPAADPASTTVEIWVRAKNPGEKLKPGGSSKVSIAAETIKDAILVPTAALLSADDGGNEVMIAGSDSLAHETKVEAGIRQGDNIQILSGVKPGDKVITVGGLGLADKAKIEVRAAGEKDEKDDKKE